MFSIHGFLRGTVAQVFVILGLFAGLWAAFLVSRWLQGHWASVQPALLFHVLRWIVAALAGTGAAALFQWWGGQLGRAVQATPAAWVDRGGGLAVGALLGLGVAAMMLMILLIAPKPRTVSMQIGRARSTAPLMATAARACSLSARYLPAGPWLTEHFQLARSRAVATRAATREPRS